jgi:hypothetical protein
VFFEILNGFILFDLLSSKKIVPPLIRVEKNFFKLGVQDIKRSGILHWFRKSAEVSSLAKRKIFYR